MLWLCLWEGHRLHFLVSALVSPPPRGAGGRLPTASLPEASPCAQLRNGASSPMLGPAAPWTLLALGSAHSRGLEPSEVEERSLPPRPPPVQVQGPRTQQQSSGQGPQVGGRKAGIARRSCAPVRTAARLPLRSQGHWPPPALGHLSGVLPAPLVAVTTLVPFPAPQINSPKAAPSDAPLGGKSFSFSTSQSPEQTLSNPGTSGGRRVRHSRRAAP